MGLSPGEGCADHWEEGLKGGKSWLPAVHTDTVVCPEAGGEK